MLKMLSLWWRIPLLLQQHVEATQALVANLQVLAGMVNKQVEESPEEPGVLGQTDEDFWEMQELERKKAKARGYVSEEENLDDVVELFGEGTESS